MQVDDIAGGVGLLDDGAAGQILVQAACGQFFRGEQDGGCLRGLGAGFAAAGMLRDRVQLEKVGQR